MARLTENGLEWDKFGTIYSQLQSLAEDRFEPLLEVGDELSTDESSVLGRILSLVASVDADQEELIYQMYANLDPEQAEGLYLDKLVRLFGMSRLQPTPALAGLILKGEIGVTVPDGSIVSNTRTGDRFSTNLSVTFDNTRANGVVIRINTVSSGTTYTLNYKELDSLNQFPPITIEVMEDETEQELANRFAQTVESITSVSGILTATVDNDNNVVVRFSNYNTIGTFTVSGGCTIIQSFQPVGSTSTTFSAVIQSASEINVIQTPVLGWLDVFNPFDSMASTNIETDSELRNRFKLNKGHSATGNREAMYSALYGLRGVTYVNITENLVDYEVDGRVAHGVSITVMGGNDDEIIDVIDRYRNLTYTQGAVTQSRYDINGNPYSVSFNRPVSVPIQIQLGLTTNPDIFPTDGMLRIQDSLINYFRSMNVSQDVAWSQLFTPINEVKGQSVNTLLIKRKSDSEWQSGNIILQNNEIAVLSYEDINP